VKLALGGDTMLGRGVAERLETEPADALFAPELVDLVREADLVVLNLECCISARGEPTPGRVFHFRAPPSAAQALAHLGVDCVTLANNHALDFGPDALLDTLSHLDAAGIRAVGAGTDLERARAPAVLEAGGFRLAVLGFADHPAEYAADADRPGIAYADLQDALPGWLTTFPDADAVLVTPHWGANMTAEPQRDVRRAAHALVKAGATLVAGHSAHVFHGVAPRVLYDLGDFLDDYRVDANLRNDLGLLFLVDLTGGRLEAIPLKPGFAHTRLAAGKDAAWIKRRFVDACPIKAAATCSGRRSHANALALLPRLLDPAGPGRRREDGRVAVVPADAQARRLLGDDLLDDALPRRLRDALGLDHDPVSRVRSHCSTSSKATLALPSSRREEVRNVATSDVTSVLDEAGVSYELLPHAHTESALAEASALGVSPDDVAKTLVVKVPGGYTRVVLPASARLDMHKLREIHGGGRHKLHLATEEELRRDYPEFELGAVPPLGAARRDPVVVDPKVAAQNTVVIEAGSHNESLRLAAADLVQLAGAAVTDISEE